MSYFILHFFTICNYARSAKMTIGQFTNAVQSLGLGYIQDEGLKYICILEPVHGLVPAIYM